MELILNRRKRVKRDIKLNDLWYIVDNSIPAEPQLVRKEFQTKALAQKYIELLMLSRWVYEVISGRKANKYDLKFIRWGEQHLPRGIYANRSIPLYLRSGQEKKRYRARLRKANARNKSKLIKAEKWA